MPKEIVGKNRVAFGTTKDGTPIYISKPKFDCGWYWSFGYLGNKNMHYHLSAYQDKDQHFQTDDGFKCFTEKRNKNMFDCLTEDYTLTTAIKENLWTVCELALSIYTLKEAAEVLGRGGSHMTTNPCKDTIINTDEVTRLNEIVIPELCQTFWDLIGGNS